MEDQRGLIQPVFVVVVIIFVVLISGVGIYLYKNNSDPTSGKQILIPSPSQLVSPYKASIETTQSTDSGELSNWKTYTSKQCRVSLDYPGDLEVLTSFDDSEFGCHASFGVVGDSSRALIFGTPIGMTWEDLLRRYPDG